MIDDKKIEEAKEEIYEDRFLLNGKEVVFDNDDTEEMFYKEDIKEAIGLGAKWAINEFLKDLWHPASEEPENKDVDIAYLDKYCSLEVLFCERIPIENWEEEVSIYQIDKWCYKEGSEGWELVNWQLCPKPLDATSLTQSTKKSVNILATWKRELHE